METKMQELAPVVLFVYKRADHTKIVINALLENDLAEDSELYIFCDGPKRDEDIQDTRQVREYVHSIKGFKEVHIIESISNKGLSCSIIDGVNYVFQKYRCSIILEDDIVVAPHFLTYMNRLLKRYETDKRFFCVTGYSYILPQYMKNVPAIYCAKISCCWGWATWKDRWELFDEKASGYEILKKDRVLRKQFDYGGCYKCYDMLIDNIERKSNDSWAIRWYYTIFARGGLTIYPKNSLVKNIGFDGSGTHCGAESRKETIGVTCDFIDADFEIKCTEDRNIRRKIQYSLKKNQKNTIQKIIQKIVRATGIK